MIRLVRLCVAAAAFGLAICGAQAAMAACQMTDSAAFSDTFDTLDPTWGVYENYHAEGGKLVITPPAGYNTATINTASLYDDVDRFESSDLINDSQKAALRYADALIWTPALIEPAVAENVLRHFTPAQARELTLDVMRNASNKIAVSLRADAARVESGTERYLIDADGQPVYS